MSFTQLPSCWLSWDETPALHPAGLPTSLQQWWFVPPWHCSLHAHRDGGCLTASSSLYMPHYPQVLRYLCHLHGIRDYYADWLFLGRGYSTAFLAGLGRWGSQHDQNCCLFLLSSCSQGHGSGFPFSSTNISRILFLGSSLMSLKECICFILSLAIYCSISNSFQRLLNKDSISGSFLSCVSPLAFVFWNKLIE